MTLPPWDDSMSDGCSGAPFLSKLLGAVACCKRHDEAYYYGGTRADREQADRALLACWLRTGEVSAWRAQLGYRIVRVMGSPQLRIKGVSWSFGGDVFAYRKDEP